MSSILDTVQLGRHELTVDPRTIMYRTLAPSPWRPPTAYDLDAEHGDVFPARMYRNDQEGDCVIAAQANQLTRLEYDEQNVIIDFSDGEVHQQYREETGGPDSGLDPIQSLNRWRNRGRTAGGNLYFIRGWAQVPAQDQQQVQEAAVVGRGLQVAVRLPISAAHQMDRGEVWDLVSGPDGQAGSWGGHQMYMKGYDAEGVYFWTWKRIQKATWRWLAAYSDFSALVIDAVDRLPNDSIDVDAFDRALADIDG